jgi:hypothetical protein
MANKENNTTAGNRFIISSSYWFMVAVAFPNIRDAP